MRKRPKGNRKDIAMVSNLNKEECRKRYNEQVREVWSNATRSVWRRKKNGKHFMRELSVPRKYVV